MKFLIVLLVNLLTGSGLIFDNKHTLRYDGEVNIGLLVDLHNGSVGNSSQPSRDGQCNRIDPQIVQQVVAAAWAIEVINNQSLQSDLKIGLQIHDTCGSVPTAQKHLFNLITATRDTSGSKVELPTLGPPILGVVGIGKVGLRSDTIGALHAFNIPLLSVGPDQPDDEMLEKYENMLSTAPDSTAEAKALTNVAFEMNVEKVFLITSKPRLHKIFEAECASHGIEIEKYLVFDSNSSYLSEIYDFLISMRGFVDPVIVLSAEAEEVLRIAERINKIQDPLPLWLVASVGLHLKKNLIWKKSFHGGLLVEPHMPELEEYKTFFLKSLKAPHSSISGIMGKYIEEVERERCQKNRSNKAGCEDTLKTFLSTFEPDPYVSFMVKAVSALAAAFRLVQLDNCLEDWKASCLRRVQPGLHGDIVRNLRRLSFTSMTATTKDQQAVTSTHHHHFTQNGRLVTQIQFIYPIDEQVDEIEQIGWFTEHDGLHIDLNNLDLEADYSLETSSSPDLFKPTTTTVLTSFISSDTTTRSSASLSTSRPSTALSLLNPSTWKPFVLKSNVDRSAHSRSITQQNLINDEVSEQIPPRQSNISLNYQVTIPVQSYESFISRTWALTILSVALLGTFIALWMLIYVIIKICDDTLGGSQTMGLVLLLGVIFLLCSVVPWLLPPNEAMCAIRHFLPPIALSLNFAVLLVKAMQLQSLARVGIGGSIPQVNQLVSLLFMVAVQAVISSEWYISNAPIVIVQDLETLYVSCDVSRVRFVLLFTYPSVLLVFTFCFGISVLKIKANYREGRWITAATITIMPVYIVWMLLCSFAPVHFHDAATSFAIVIIALLILCIVFAPKMHTISHEGKKSSDKSGGKLSAQNPYNTSSLSDSTMYNIHLPRHHLSKYYPSYTYAPNTYLQREQMRETSNTVPYPKRLRDQQLKNKVVHIHGTNGAKFNGLNFITTSQAYPSEEDRNGTIYEDDWWTSPSQEQHCRKPKRHEHHHKHKHRGLEVQSHHRSQKSHSKSPEEEIFQKLKRLSKDSHGVHLGTGIDEKQPACVSGTSTTSSSEKKSFGCTVKGSSAIVLTPDSIVYNDNGIWSHRYDSSK